MANITSNVNTTISFVAQASDGDSISVEVLEKDQKKGVTTFYDGDVPIFRVYFSENLAQNNLSFWSSDGNTDTQLSDLKAGMSLGVYEETIREIVTFSGSNEASVSKPIISDFTYTPLSTNATSYVGAMLIPYGPTSIKTTKEVLAVEDGGIPMIGAFLVTYKTRYFYKVLKNVVRPTSLNADESYPVTVYIFGSRSA